MHRMPAIHRVGWANRVITRAVFLAGYLRPEPGRTRPG